MSDDEKYLLDHVLNMLGQFDGLPEFAQLNALAKGLDIHDHRKIICLSENPLRDTNIFGSIYSTIVHHQVIRLKYHIFTGPTIERSVFVHPYMLKEYNRRWYLFCSAFDTGKILNFALDRINSIEPMPSMEYKDCPDELVERFEDIIGVTFHEGCPVETITFWVSDKSLGYVKLSRSMSRRKTLPFKIKIDYIMTIRPFPVAHSSALTAFVTTNSSVNYHRSAKSLLFLLPKTSVKKLSHK